MSKQTKVLESILFHFDKIQNPPNNHFKQSYIQAHEIPIKYDFKKSLNKNEIIRRLLNEVVLSNDEIIELLRIIYRRKNE